jgi:hypothetical protein
MRVMSPRDTDKSLPRAPSTTRWLANAWPQISCRLSDGNDVNHGGMSRADGDNAVGSIVSISGGLDASGVGVVWGGRAVVGPGPGAGTGPTTDTGWCGAAGPGAVRLVWRRLGWVQATNAAGREMEEEFWTENTV